MQKAEMLRTDKDLMVPIQTSTFRAGFVFLREYKISPLKYKMVNLWACSFNQKNIQNSIFACQTPRHMHGIKCFLISLFHCKAS